jgi:hypothetical protein
MLRNYYINKEFLVSATARRVYRLAASASVGLLVMLFALKIAGHVPADYFLAVKLLVFVGVAGTALNMVAMEYFLFVFDTSSIYKKVFWFCAITMVLMLGAALYCFLVYSRSEVVNSQVPGRARSASA